MPSHETFLSAMYTACAVGIVGFIGWMAKQAVSESKANEKSIIQMKEARLDALESNVEAHIALCNEKGISSAKLESRVQRIEEKVDDLKGAISDRADTVDEMHQKIDRIIEKIS